MKATVVVPVFNAEKTIGNCLAALAQQSLPRDSYEIIVVDDGSYDGTAQIAEKHQVKLIRLSKQGPAMARNQGAREARGEIVVFTDADCTPGPAWLEWMLEPFQRSEVVGVKGAYRSTQRELVARFVQLEYEDKYDRMRRDDSIDFIDTYSAAYRRDVFLQNGGFDVTFPDASVEDQEFSFRLASRGYRMVFQPSATVNHQHADSVLRYFRKKFRIGYWKVYVHRKHPDKLMRDSHTPQALKLQTALAPIIIGGLAVSVFRRRLLAVPLGASGLFFVSAAPFIAKAMNSDRPVAVCSPLLLIVRAVGLSTGLIVGLFGAPGASKVERPFR